MAGILVDTSLLHASDVETGPQLNPYCRHGGVHVYCPYSMEQDLYCSSTAKEVFFGGAAGPGKTVTILNEGARYVQYSTYRAIFFRRTYPELRQVLDMALDTFPRMGAKYTEKDHCFTFPSGAKYYLAYLEKDADKLRYQGMAFHRVMWDELTQWPTDSAYKYLWTRNRPYKPDPSGFVIPCQIRAASNPGGPGHGWVFQRFIKDAPKYKPRMIRAPNGRFYDRVFIPATLDSNDILLKSNHGDYETSLLSHPDEQMRRALRYGDWNIISGAIFTELAEHTHRSPGGGPRAGTSRVVSADWAFAGEAVALWVETDSGIGHAPRSNVYQEWCTSEKHPALWAAEVIERSKDLDGNVTISRIILDSAAWSTPQDGSPSPAEQMMPILRRYNIPLVRAQKGPHSIASGIVLLHTYFWTSERSPRPLLTISNDCPQLWEQLTTVQRGDINRNQDPEVPAPNQRVDRLDALRYWAADRPRPADITERDYRDLDEDWRRFKDDIMQLEAARAERRKTAKLPYMSVQETLRREVKRKQRRRPWDR